MSRPKDDKKAAVLLAITEHLNLHGPQNWNELMVRFPDVSRPTFFRWIKEAKEAMESQASSRGTGALKLMQKRIRSQVEVNPERTQMQLKAQLPVAPSPALLSQMPGEVVHQTFDFMSYFAEVVEDAELVKQSAITVNADGTKKVKNPMLLDNNIRRRLDIMTTFIQSVQAVWNLGKMEELYDAVIEEIGKVDPETQQAILARLRDLNNRRGMTVHARLG